MFNLNDSIRYYLYPFPTDMRKSFYTLSGIVSQRMGEDVRGGDAFIFINRTCNSMKILHMEHGGLVIYHLKLESGVFKLPELEQVSQTYRSSWCQIMLLVQGLNRKEFTVGKRWKNPKKVEK